MAGKKGGFRTGRLFTVAACASLAILALLKLHSDRLVGNALAPGRGDALGSGSSSSSSPGHGSRSALRSSSGETTALPVVAQQAGATMVPAAAGAAAASAGAAAAEEDGEDGGGVGGLPFYLLDPARVEKLPHVRECRACKVCIPDGAAGAPPPPPPPPGALSGGAGRQRRRARRRRQQLLFFRKLAAVGAASGQGASLLDGAKTHAAWVAAHGNGPVTANVTRSGRPLGVEVVIGYTNTSFQWDGVTYNIAPRSTVHAAGLIRTCPVCRGCAQELRWMPKGVHMLGSYYTHETGASPGWLLRTQSNRSRTGEAAVKIWCVPLKKPGSSTPPSCKPERIRHQLQTVLAQQRVAKDCGLQDILPAHWVAPVRSVLPTTGYRVEWDALWAELSRGVSLENVVSRGAPLTDPAAVLELLQRTVNSSDVVAAAVVDLLTSQCDRHAQNVHVSDRGRLLLIDNDQAYGSSWRPCGVDSLFLPGTQKHAVVRLGFKYVMKVPRDAPARAPTQRGANPLQLLDYRCHAPGGEIGTAYPENIKSCLGRIAAMSKSEVRARYGFPHLATAAALQRRASDMLTRGFEWTLQHGWPRNPIPSRYRIAPPCCRMRTRLLQSGARPAYECEGGGSSGGSGGSAIGSSSGGSSGGGSSSSGKGSGSIQDSGDVALPRGEPYFGGPWRESIPDTGTYELGSPAEGPGFKWPDGWAAGAWLGDDEGAPDPGYAPVEQPNMYNH